MFTAADVQLVLYYADKYKRMAIEARGEERLPKAVRERLSRFHEASRREAESLARRIATQMDWQAQQGAQ